MGILRFISVTLLLFVSQLQAANKPSQIIISQVATTNIELKIIKTLRQAYDNIGIKLIIKPYLPKRSLVLSNNGFIDGEMSRIKEIGTIYPNLRVIPVPIYRVKTAVYTINGLTEANSLKPILASSIAIKNGFHWQENLIQSQNTRVTRVQTKVQQFKMLVLGRVNYVLSTQETAKNIIERDYPQAGIIQVSVPLEPLQLFHFLHQRHQGLIPQLTEQITKIIAMEKASMTELATKGTKL